MAADRCNTMRNIRHQLVAVAAAEDFSSSEPGAEVIGNSLSKVVTAVAAAELTQAGARPAARRGTHATHRRPAARRGTHATPLQNHHRMVMAVMGHLLEGTMGTNGTTKDIHLAKQEEEEHHPRPEGEEVEEDTHHRQEDHRRIIEHREA